MSQSSESEDQTKQDKCKVLGIYHTDANGIESFTFQYAVTQFEAQRFCVEEAKSMYRELTGNRDPGSVLWFGQTPKEPGTYLTYGFPGPDKRKIDIIRFDTIKGWFGGVHNLSKRLYSYEYRPIYRVAIKAPEVPASEIIKAPESPVSSRLSEDVNDGSLFSCIKNFDKNKLRSSKSN